MLASLLTWTATLAFFYTPTSKTSYFMIRKAILDALRECGNEERLTDTLQAIITAHGDEACKELFHIMTSLNLSPKESRQCWDGVLAHQTDLSRQLKRQVSFRTAICDFFCSVQHSLKNPKVVEIHVFEKTLNDSRYDKLTGLLNRKTMDEVLKKEISRARRYDLNLSLLFFDLDNFKEVNDKYGHQAGDLLLRKVSEIIRNEKREEDLAARYGGEELIVVLPETDRLEALILGERIREKVEALALKRDDDTISLTISGGVASFPVNATDQAGLIACADKALYQAKGAGKNSIALFSSDKRRYTRIDFSKDIQLKQLNFVEKEHHTARSKDISVGGLLFEHQAPLAIDTKIELSIPLASDSPLYIIGTVVRVEALGEGKYDIGITISFLEMDRTTKSEISKYLLHELGTNPALNALMSSDYKQLSVRNHSVI